MKIARISASKQGETDRLLSQAAAQLQAEGITLAGIVKVLTHSSEFENGCDMKVRVLPAGPVVNITQNLGKGSDACRLDPGAIANAVLHVENGPLAEARLFILNKFGPEEAAGRGFCGVIGQALEYDIPVLVGVGSASLEAFNKFADGLAESIHPDAQSIRNWCLSAMS